MGRREGIDRWKLPHLMRDIEITLTEGDGQISVAASTGGEPILELIGTSHRFEPAELLFHTHSCPTPEGTTSRTLPLVVRVTVNTSSREARS